MAIDCFSFSASAANLDINKSTTSYNTLTAFLQQYSNAYKNKKLKKPNKNEQLWSNWFDETNVYNSP